MNDLSVAAEVTGTSHAVQDEAELLASFLQDFAQLFRQQAVLK